MRIGLIDVDGHNFPNLPLMKISAWHRQFGHSVEMYDALTGEAHEYDKVYMSKVFTFTPDYAFPVYAREIEHGGSGYSVKAALPDEVERIYPDYGLYGIKNTAYGFLTRGCPRRCEFCIVGEKEGCGETVEVIITPKDGWKLVSVTDNGHNVTMDVMNNGDGTWTYATFERYEGHIVDIVFEIDTEQMHDVNVSKTGQGTATADAYEDVPGGSDVTVTIIPAPGWKSLRAFLCSWVSPNAPRCGETHRLAARLFYGIIP